MLEPSPDELNELRGVATRIAARLLPTAEVEDIAQEAMFRLTSEWKRVRTYAAPWVVRVTTNLAIAELRRNGREVALRIADAPEQPELQLDLVAAIRALPVRQRQVVTLRYLADLDERSVAELLGCSRGAVKRHLHRAIAALRISPRLTRQEDQRMAIWQDNFTEAVEPDSGWPERPWDHWFLEFDGTWDRVAVDATGDPILDADGDEVMSGPGFDHAVVKVTSEYDMGPPDPRPVTSFGDVAARLDEAAKFAHYFGHPWVGHEHLALAMAAHAELPGVDIQVLRRRVATFYEGPFAEARLTEVDRRAAGGSFVRPAPDQLSWTRALHESVRNRDLAGIADDLLTTDGHSLVRHLLDT